MTDRIKGLIVTLDHDYRDDDAERIIGAIGMIKGVINVGPVVTDINDHINRTTIRLELENKLFEILQAAYDESPK